MTDIVIYIDTNDHEDYYNGDDIRIWSDMTLDIIDSASKKVYIIGKWWPEKDSSGCYYIMSRITRTVKISDVKPRSRFHVGHESTLTGNYKIDKLIIDAYNSYIVEKELLR